MAVIRVEFARHIRFFGKLVDHIEPGDGITVELQGSFVEVRKGGKCRVVPLSQVLALDVEKAGKK